MEKTLVGVEGLERIKDTLLRDIEYLQIDISNLEAQKHTLTVKTEADTGAIRQEVKKELYEDEQRVNKAKEENNALRNQLMLQEEHLKKRYADLEQREVELVDLEEKRKGLNEERNNFNKYKFDVERKLDEMRVTIAEAEASREEIRMANEMLVGREKKVIEQEKWWNDRIGELQATAKEVQIQIENLKGLEKGQEKGQEAGQKTEVQSGEDG